jgi:hypothetical protein
MDYTGLVRSLQLPAGFEPPQRLSFGDLSARVITRADLDDDVAGINASLDLIRSTRGGSWPTEAVTAEYDYQDLVWHEVEFRDGYSYSYTVYVGGKYVGCCYLYPMGRRTPLTERLMAHDVDVSWWVTPDAYARGHYVALYQAAQHWATRDFPFRNPYYSNVLIPTLDQ